MQNIKIILTFIILFFVTNITVASSDNSSIPHTFTSGSTISSSEINNNFTHVTPYLVKSNGNPLGVYFILDLAEYNGKIFFNGNYRSAIDLTGSLYTHHSSDYLDSNCTMPIGETAPGLVARFMNTTLTTSNTNIIFNDYAHYIPLEATPLFDQSDVDVTSYYLFASWNNPPTCDVQTVRSYMVDKYYLFIPNDPNVTGIQSSYPTPITVGK